MQASERLRRKALKLLAADAAAVALLVSEADTAQRAAMAPAVEAALSFAPLLSEFFVVTGEFAFPSWMLGLHRWLAEVSMSPLHDCWDSSSQPRLASTWKQSWLWQSMMNSIARQSEPSCG